MYLLIFFCPEGLNILTIGKQLLGIYCKAVVVKLSIIKLPKIRFFVICSTESEFLLSKYKVIWLMWNFEISISLEHI